MSTFLHEGKAADTLDRTQEFNIDGFAIGRFGQLAVERGLEHVGSASWSTDQESLDAIADRVLSSVNGKHAPFVRPRSGFDSCERL